MSLIKWKLKEIRNISDQSAVLFRICIDNASYRYQIVVYSCILDGRKIRGGFGASNGPKSKACGSRSWMIGSSLPWYSDIIVSTKGRGTLNLWVWEP